MKKSALLRSVAADTGVPYGTVKRIMDVALDQIVEQLRTGNRVVLSGFGTFALRPYKARNWVNPQTNRLVEIPAALRPGFITSAALKRRLGLEDESTMLAEASQAADAPDAAPPRRRRTTRAAAMPSAAPPAELAAPAKRGRKRASSTG